MERTQQIRVSGTDRQGSIRMEQSGCEVMTRMEESEREDKSRAPDVPLQSSWGKMQKGTWVALTPSKYLQAFPHSSA